MKRITSMITPMEIKEKDGMPILTLQVIVTGEEWQETDTDEFLCPFRLYNFSTGSDGGNTWNPEVFGLGNLYNALTVQPETPRQGYHSNVHWGNGNEGVFKIVIDALIREALYETGYRVGRLISNLHVESAKDCEYYVNVNTGSRLNGIIPEYINACTEYIRSKV